MTENIPAIELMTAPAQWPIDWNDAYANAAYITGAEHYPSRWAQMACQFRDNRQTVEQAQIHVSYGAHDRQVYDLFLPDEEIRGLAVIVHGGYWLRFDQNDWSHLASGAIARGYATAIIGYPLCPEVSIKQIAQSITAAVQHVASRVPGPINLAGHSAGGHLVTRLICQDTQLSAGTLKRIQRVLSISGVHDLLPLLQTRLNDTLHLNHADAMQNSPARLLPLAGSNVCTWVGANERPEFIRQSSLLYNIWQALGARMATAVQPDRHHFDVIEELQNPDSAMLSWWLSE